MNRVDCHDGVTVYSGTRSLAPSQSASLKIDQSSPIVVETAQIPNRANSPLKSKAKNFDGSSLGFRPSRERNCAFESVGYDSQKP
jgi:hypothetical protein